MGYLKSKTLWFSVMLALLSAASGYLGLMFPDPKWQAAAGIVIAVCIAVLRIVTTQPLSEK